MAGYPLVSIAFVLGLVLAPANPATASTLRISPGSETRAANETEADYGTTHIFIDELAHQAVPITVFFDPQIIGVAEAQVFTNLDRREMATVAPPGGIAEGINPPSGNSFVAGDESHYWHALPLQPVQGG
jgi:hypothetical protein